MVYSSEDLLSKDLYKLSECVFIKQVFNCIRSMFSHWRIFTIS